MKKTIISIVLIVLLSLTTILLDFLTFSWELIFDPKYWIETLSIQIPIAVIILAVRDIAIDSERKKNGEYQDAIGTINKAYLEIHRSKERLQSFLDYIKSNNRARKIKAYEDRLDREIFRLTTKNKKLELSLQGRAERLRLKAEKKALLQGKITDPREHNPLWQIRVLVANKRLEKRRAKITLLESRREKAEKVVDYIRVKYSEVSYATLFTDTTARQSDSFDLAIHNGRDIGMLMLSRVLGIIAVGIIISSAVLSAIEGEPFVIAYTIVSRGMQIALAIYSGMSAGQEFLRNEILLRLKLRITYLQAFLYTT